MVSPTKRHSQCDATHGHDRQVTDRGNFFGALLPLVRNDGSTTRANGNSHSASRANHENGEATMMNGNAGATSCVRRRFGRRHISVYKGAGFIADAP